jgi:hypothetical protein
MKSETNWIIAGLMFSLLAVTVMGFFLTPAYEKMVWFAGGVFGTQLANVLGFKFGRSMPQQSTDAKPGQTSETQTTIATTPDPPKEPTL